MRSTVNSTRLRRLSAALLAMLLLAPAALAEGLATDLGAGLMPESTEAPNIATDLGASLATEAPADPEATEDASEGLAADLGGGFQGTIPQAEAEAMQTDFENADVTIG